MNSVFHPSTHLTVNDLKAACTGLSIPCAFSCGFIGVAFSLRQRFQRSLFPPSVTGLFSLGLLGNFSSTEPEGLECDGCSGLGAWRGGLVPGLCRSVRCSDALGV